MKVCFCDDSCDISHSYINDIYYNDIERSSLEEADVVIYVGCAYEKMKIDSSNESLENIIANMRRDAKLGVFGCITKYDEFYNSFKDRKEIDYIGRGTGLEMQNEIKNYLNSNKVTIDTAEMGFYLTSPRRLNIIVQDGCNNRCAFCKSNYLNLHLSSRPMDRILSLVKDFHNAFGIDEINITGLNPSQYGNDLADGTNLTTLIKKISSLGYIKTIFLDMLCISDITDELLMEIVSNPIIKRVMIPVQSFDNRLLKLMGRKNDAMMAFKIIDTINRERPDIFLETIFLATYPTEDIENIRLNIGLLNSFNINNPVVSPYTYGKNVSTLKSENIKNVTNDEIEELRACYCKYLMPIIERQRKELLSRPVLGRLINRDEQFDYYSTFYRFMAMEYVIRCPRDDNNQMYEYYELSTDMLPSSKEYFNCVANQNGNGKVLKRLSDKNNV